MKLGFFVKVLLFVKCFENLICVVFYELLFKNFYWKIVLILSLGNFLKKVYK